MKVIKMCCLMSCIVLFLVGCREDGLNSAAGQSVLFC